MGLLTEEIEKKLEAAGLALFFAFFAEAAVVEPLEGFWPFY